jgi:hypothetical protein
MFLSYVLHTDNYRVRFKRTLQIDWHCQTGCLFSRLSLLHRRHQSCRIGRASGKSISRHWPVMCNRGAGNVMEMCQGSTETFFGWSTFPECGYLRYILVVLWWGTPDFNILVDRNVAELSHGWKASRYLKLCRSSTWYCIQEFSESRDCRLVGSHFVEIEIWSILLICILKLFVKLKLWFWVLCRAGACRWLQWIGLLWLCGVLSDLHFCKSLLQEPLYTSVGTALPSWEVCSTLSGNNKWVCHLSAL